MDERNERDEESLEGKKGKKKKKAKKPKKGKGGEEGGAEGEEKSGSKKKLIIIILAAVLVIGAAAAYIFVLPHPEKPIVYSYYVTGDPYYANLRDSNNLLRASVVLVLNTDDAKLHEALAFKNAVIRDTIIFIMRDLDAKTVVEDISQDNLRKNIVEVLNRRLEIDNIVGVLFGDFVMQ